LIELMFLLLIGVVLGVGVNLILRVWNGDWD
jgi:hypothetical protein